MQIRNESVSRKLTGHSFKHGTNTHTTCREKLLQEREVAQLEGCTFQPCINNTANGKQRPSSTGRAPLHKRVAEVLRNKNEHLSRARISLVGGKSIGAATGHS